MLYVLEFEFVEDENIVRAIPLWSLGGATEGETLEEATEYAADFLRMYVDDALMNNYELPEIHVGHDPTQGGKIIALAVARDLDEIPSVTAADAARVLGISTPRVNQLINAGVLDSWKEGNKRLVSKESLYARLEQHPKAGRPKARA